MIYPGGFLGVWDMCLIALSDLAAMPPSPTCGGGTAGMIHGNYIVTNIFAPGANPPYDRDQLVGVADPNDIYVIGYDAQGPGAWSYATRYVGTGPAREVAAGDLNGDGINDVLVANDGSLSVFLAHAGTGGIDVGAEAAPAGGSLETPSWFQLADVDADGRLDAIVGGTDAQNDAEFAVMLGHGDGTFAAPVRFAMGFDPSSTAWWMGVADLNGDGKPDVVIVNGDERTVRVFLNTTTVVGTTTTTTTLPTVGCTSIVTERRRRATPRRASSGERRRGCRTGSGRSAARSLAPGRAPEGSAPGSSRGRAPISPRWSVRRRRPRRGGRSASRSRRSRTRRGRSARSSPERGYAVDRRRPRSRPSRRSFALALTAGVTLR